MILFAFMKAQPTIFDELDEAGEAQAVADAETSIAAGRIISHDAMKAWLLSWGTPDEQTPPSVGD
jgi:predicted transcriptional regulator